MQNLIDVAAKMFLKNAGGNADISSVVSAFQGLLPTNNGDLDIAGLVSKFSGGGGNLMSMAASFLGDGKNDSFSPTDVLSLFGDSKVEEFAGKVGVTKDQAVGGLASVIPDLIDKSSEGGSLLQGGALSMGKKLLGGLF